MNRWWPIAALVIVPAALYVRVAGFDYVRADDVDLIRANQPFLRDLGNVPAAFQRGYFDIGAERAGDGTYYRPLVIVSFMVDAQIGGASPRAYHLTNLAVHGAAVVLLFVLLRRLASASSRLPAFLLVLLFAVHPANTQAVCWIPGRNDTLLAVFALLSIIALVRFLDAPHGSASRWWVPLHVAGFAAALYTKETALALILLYPLYAALWTQRLRQYLRHWWLFVAYAVVLLGWHALRVRAVSMPGSMTAADYGRTLLGNAQDLLLYAGKLVLPFRLSVMPGLTAVDAALGIVSLALLGAMFSRIPLRRRVFAIAWVLAFLVPALLVPGLPAYEHRLYLPLMGIVVAAAELPVWRVAAWRRAIVPAAGAIALMFSAVAFAHAGVFRNPYTYWSSATRGTPHAGIAHVNLGQMYEADGDPARAEEHYRLALGADPTAPGAHNNLGTLLARRGHLQAARAEFEREVALHPSNAEAHFNLGLVQKLSGRIDEAVPFWQRAIAIDPHHGPAHRELAQYYTARGDAAQAAHYLEQLKALEVPAPP